jgi:hypothetical protein
MKAKSVVVVDPEIMNDRLCGSAEDGANFFASSIA